MFLIGLLKLRFANNFSHHTYCVRETFTFQCDLLCAIKMEKVREKSNFVISDDLKDFVKGCESNVKYLGTPVKSENDRKEYR